VCGWDTATNNWNYYHFTNPECQNGEPIGSYGFLMDCYYWDGE
jgi:hypothetical protein